MSHIDMRFAVLQLASSHPGAIEQTLDRADRYAAFVFTETKVGAPYVKQDVATENHAHAPKAATQERNVQVAEQVTAQVEAPTEITSDDCVKAYSAYVGRGNGRNAMTGKKIMTDMQVASFKTATQEQRAALIQKYATE